MAVRELPAVDKRVETGPVQFGEDWPGLFIRGDDAAYLALNIKQILADLGDKNGFAARNLESIMSLIFEGVIVKHEGK